MLKRENFLLNRIKESVHDRLACLQASRYSNIRASWLIELNFERFMAFMSLLKLLKIGFISGIFTIDVPLESQWYHIHKKIGNGDYSWKRTKD